MNREGSFKLKTYWKPAKQKLLFPRVKYYRCEHVLVKLIDSWKYALDEDNFAGTLLIDLSKYFIVCYMVY